MFLQKLKRIRVARECFWVKLAFLFFSCQRHTLLLIRVRVCLRRVAHIRSLSNENVAVLQLRSFKMSLVCSSVQSKTLFHLSYNLIPSGIQHYLVFADGGKHLNIWFALNISDVNRAHKEAELSVLWTCVAIKKVSSINKFILFNVIFRLHCFLLLLVVNRSSSNALILKWSECTSLSLFEQFVISTDLPENSY